MRKIPDKYWIISIPILCFIMFIWGAIVGVNTVIPDHIEVDVGENYLEAINTLENISKNVNKNCTKELRLVDRSEFVEFCNERNPPSIISCVIGCREGWNTYISQYNDCNSAICKFEGEPDCDKICMDKYVNT